MKIGDMLKRPRLGIECLSAVAQAGKMARKVKSPPLKLRLGKKTWRNPKENFYL